MMKEMGMVQSGQLDVEDAGTRGADWPTVTNIGVRPGYNGMQARVEQYISEASPVQFGRFADWNSALLLF
jgi:FAD synthase